MYKILIIDDEINNIFLLEEILEDYEKTISIMKTVFGFEGLDIIKKEKPDVVFLDMLLPMMSGAEICKIVKEDLKMKDVKIVLLTAMQDAFVDNEGKRIEVDAYIQKPYRASEILSVLNELLQE